MHKVTTIRASAIALCLQDLDLSGQLIYSFWSKSKDDMSFLSYVRDISEMHFCASQSFSYQVNPQGLLFIHSSHFAL